MFPSDLIHDAQALLARLREQQKRLVTAESCTGGLLAGLLTEIPGSSDVVERGFVTYSNDAKSECLGVPLALIERHGAVSIETAEAMARGALQHARADLSVAITGIAGPGGGSLEKPVGLVFIAAAARNGALADAECRFGDIGRKHVRMASLRAAIALIGELTANG